MIIDSLSPSEGVSSKSRCVLEFLSTLGYLSRQRYPLLISFETGHCHHMPFPYSSSSSSNNSLLLLLFLSSLPFSLSESSSGLLIVGGGGAWNSAEFWPTLSCQPPTLPRALDTPSLGLVGDQVGDISITKKGNKRKEKQLRLHDLNINTGMRGKLGVLSHQVSLTN